MSPICLSLEEVLLVGGTVLGKICAVCCRLLLVQKVSSQFAMIFLQANSSKLLQIIGTMKLCDTDAEIL